MITRRQFITALVSAIGLAVVGLFAFRKRTDTHRVSGYVWLSRAGVYVYDGTTARPYLISKAI